MNQEIYHINSANRLDGNDSNFSYKLRISPDKKFNRCSVLQANIPKSYYVVQSNQNTFTLTEGLNNYTITVPVGNYTRTSFKTKIQTLLNNAGDFTYVVSAPLTSDVETGKYNYNVSDNVGVQPSFTFTTYLYEQMGFNKNTTNNFESDTLISSNVINLQREATIFIHSDLCSNTDNNVLQEVFTSESADFGYINYLNPDPKTNSKLLKSVDGTYHFYLTDENGNEINLNGRNWVMSVMLYYDDNINDLIRKYIKLETMLKTNK